MNLGGIKVGALELERIANEHPAVLESAATSVPPRGGGPEALVLHVVLRKPIEPSRLERELSRMLAERLNPLFRVGRVEVLDSLPRTASNKIIRRALRALR
jgi:acetyl-CoA synthetase